MKKIILSLLALVALASCSKSENGTPDTPGGPVPIRLGAGVDAATKAPIVQGNEVPAGIAGWENSAADYASAPTWSDGQIKTTANGTTAQSVTWENNTQKYYNAEGGIKTYMKAWYPRGTVDVSSPTSPKVAFTNTVGDVDALLAPAIEGSKTDVANKTLAFVHKTTQLKFKVVAGTGLAAGTKIKSITLKNVQLPTGFDLTKASTAADAVTYAAAADLAVPNLTEAAIPATAADAGDAVMIKPWADNTLQIDIVTVKADGSPAATYSGKTFTTDDSKLSESSAYTVTLTFGQAEIGLQATITDWTPKNGSGTIE